MSKTAQEFWDACNVFDWYFNMSDDYRSWKRGKKSEEELLKERDTPEKEEIYRGFVNWINKKGPKPERPK